MQMRGAWSSYTKAKKMRLGIFSDQIKNFLENPTLKLLLLFPGWSLTHDGSLNNQARTISHL